MRSATSYFDWTVFSKTIKRFWPLWGSYLFLWLLLVPFHIISMGNQEWPPGAMAEAAREVHLLLPAGLCLAFLYGLAAAMAVFGYLYNSRAACMTHALPLRRENLFWSHYLAGLLFLIGPHVAVGVATLGIESLRGILAPGSLGVWLLGQSAMCLFFYSFAVFCGMFTGNMVALPIFYGILNVLVYYLVETVKAYMGQFLYGMTAGISGEYDLVAWCTPLVRMSAALRHNLEGTAYFDEPGVLAAYAAAGAALTVLALLVYQRRQVETAGDVVAVRVVRPVFQYGVAVSSGLLGTIILYIFWGVSNPEHVSLVLSVIAWSVAGYFAATMLLDKSFRVFHRWKGAAGLAAAILAFTLALEFDLLGYERRVPKAEDVADVPNFTVSGLVDRSGGNGLAIDQASGLGTDPERQAKLIALQQAILSLPEDQRERGGDNSFTIRFDYELEGGSTLSRQYYSVPVREEDRDTPGTITWCLEQLLSDRELVRYSFRLDEAPPLGSLTAEVRNVLEEGTDTHTGIYNLDNRTSVRLWEAVQRDFDEGNIGMYYLFPDEAWDSLYDTELQFYWLEEAEDAPAGDSYTYTGRVTLCLGRASRHTIAALEESGALDGYRLAG